MQKSPENFPTVIIFSELDELSFCLCKIFLEKNCLVKIICKLKTPWQKAIKEREFKNVAITTFSQIKKEQNPNYIIYHLNPFKISEKNFKKVQKRELQNIQVVAKLVNTKKVKSAILLPSTGLSRYLLETCKKKLGADIFQGINTIFYSETVGSYWRARDEGFFGRMLKQASAGLPVTLVRPPSASPLASAGSVAEAVVKILLSFGQEAEVYITGPTLSSQQFFEKLLILNPSLMAKEETGNSTPEFVVRQRFLVEPPTDEEIFQALAPLKDVPEKKKGGKINLDETKKAVIYFVFSICIFLILPYLVFATGSGFIVAAGYLAMKQKLPAAEKLLTMSQGAATFSKRGFSVLVKLPLGKKLFGPGLSGGDLLEKTANIGLNATSILKSLEGLSEKFFAEEPYELTHISEQLFLELDFIYREMGFLQGEIDSHGGDRIFLPIRNDISEKISLVREKISHAKDIVRELPWLLGEKQKRVYLVLFQNNMELRPTGGYIGSFALVTIEQGRLAAIEVQDVFTADGQLKGHVEPPGPIKKYLGEAGWFLRDSNWDPDFAVSAQRAEWFLDKELGIRVDGVLALDLEAARKILDVVGEIQVNDFSKTITSQNLYEQTREQIEENFFSGSRAKASFLTAVSTSLINSISETNPEKRLRMVPAVVSGLEERNIQLFIHNAPTLKAIEGLGWSGELPGQACENPCVSDWVGLAEANVGVNKANYYIERKVDLSVVLSGEEIQKTLSISWKNNAAKSIGEKGRYETYLRVLGPRGEFGGGQKKMGQSVVDFTPDVVNVRGHVEAGTIVEVFPQESSTVSFSWTSPVELSSEKGEYLLTVRKQAGTVADPWEIEISNKINKKIKADPAGLLTGTSGFGYNKFLARDFVSRISW